MPTPRTAVTISLSHCCRAADFASSLAASAGGGRRAEFACDRSVAILASQPCPESKLAIGSSGFKGKLEPDDRALSLSATPSRPSVSVHDATSHHGGCPARRDTGGRLACRSGRPARAYSQQCQLPASQLLLGGRGPDRVRRDAHLDRALERQEVVADREPERGGVGGHVLERGVLPG